MKCLFRSVSAADWQEGRRIETPMSDPLLRISIGLPFLLVLLLSVAQCRQMQTSWIWLKISGCKYWRSVSNERFVASLSGFKTELKTKTGTQTNQCALWKNEETKPRVKGRKVVFVSVCSWWDVLCFPCQQVAAQNSTSGCSPFSCC